MSRPPRPHYEATTTGDPTPGLRRIDYLPHEHADLLDLATALAVEELGVRAGSEQGDFGRSLLDLSALVAHVLSQYQDRYANEAFLSTAESPRSLVRHGRRLAYEPDPGVAATGYVAFTAGAGLTGTIGRGFAVASSPVGERKAQDYETLDDLVVQGIHNDLAVRDSTRPVTVMTGATQLVLAATGLGLEPQAWMVVRRAGYLGAHRILASSESAAGDTTSVSFWPPYPGPAAPASAFTVLARPRLRLRLFGWNSSPLSFSEAELRGVMYQGTDHPRWGYVASPYDDRDIYLDGQPEEPLLGQVVLRLEPTGTAAAFALTAETVRTVTFQKTTQASVVTGMTWPANDFSKPPTLTTGNVDVHVAVSGPVVAVRATNALGVQLTRTAQDIRGSVWLTGWEVETGLATTVPSLVPVDAAALAIQGAAVGLVPGQLLLMTTLDGTTRAVVELTTVAVGPTSALVSYVQLASTSPSHTWRLGDLRLAGNVTRISHGKTVSDTLGGSDGVTPFLRFELSESPLTHLPGVDGADPALEVRVGGVLWEAVPDFYTSAPDDLHYRLLRDENGVTTVLFGDGMHGAVPPFGRKHIDATYRVGLGVDGNVDAGAVRRIKKASPLVQAASNPLPVGGGAEPAVADDVRVQATRHIRAFDRAVSVTDHADLAVLFPGVSRASATWADVAAGGPRGVRVHIADSTGETPATLAVVEAFLRERRDNAIPLVVVGVEPVDIRLGLYLEIDPTRLVRDVKDAVARALHGVMADRPGMFTFAARQLDQPAFLSEVYERVDAEPGVAFVEATSFAPVASTSAQVADVITAPPGHWLRLAPENLVFTTPSGGS